MENTSPGYYPQNRQRQKLEATNSIVVSCYVLAVSRNGNTIDWTLITGLKVSNTSNVFIIYRVSHNWVFTLFLLFCWLLLILISKVGIVLENSGNLLHDRHKNFENQFRNGLDNWGQSCHPSFWYLQFVITQRQQNNFHVKVGNFDLNYLSHFWIDFQNLCAYHVANVLNLSKLPQLLPLGWVEAGKITETKWILNCGTPCH